MDVTAPSPEKSRDRLSEITLDPKSIANSSANIEHEREVAIFDILDGNSFAVEGIDCGPYTLQLGIAEERLQLSISSVSAGNVAQYSIQLTPLKRIMKDYFLVCESYYEAVRSAPPAKIQAIDVNRRSLHDEGSVILRERLLSKVVVDADTARRLFTLLCALHWKG
jgi:uncharacterized protein (UPF0262 family)